MARTDRTTTEFPKMGNYPAGSVVNTSGAPSAHTITRPKQGGPTGMIEPATAKSRANILERMGCSYAPQATLYKQNAAEASATLRNVRLLPSAVGNRDFYLRRQYGQGV